jgi:hypothetical protein
MIWSVVAFAVGSFLMTCGVTTLFWWRKRNRWERCTGTITDIKSGRDAEGDMRHHPQIEGVHRSEHFKFTGEGSARELEVGSHVQVSYDPKTGRYFDYHPVTLWLSIIVSIAGGISLYVFAWILYSRN